VYAANLKSAGRGVITTEILSAPTLSHAAEYLQQYLAENPNGYCVIGGCGVPFELAEVEVGENAQELVNRGSVGEPEGYQLATSSVRVFLQENAA
jgi:diadenosine tetraphosphatase ApaH/serine/threonine PP2A family protein phosphatase